MNILRKMLQEVNIRKTVITAAIGVPVVAFINYLAKDGGKAFFQEHLFTIRFSLAGLASVFTGLFLITLLVSHFIVKYRKLTIIEAQYGVKGKYLDITPEVVDLISGNRLNIRLSNGITGGYDPVPHVHKNAIIKYKLGRKEYKATISEGDRIIIP
jgi:hypothetical protein